MSYPFGIIKDRQWSGFVFTCMEITLFLTQQFLSNRTYNMNYVYEEGTEWTEES